jgi:hypothetical protein
MLHKIDQGGGANKIKICIKICRCCIMDGFFIDHKTRVFSWFLKSLQLKSKYWKSKSLWTSIENSTICTYVASIDGNSQAQH